MLILVQIATHSILVNKDSFNPMDVSTASIKNTVLSNKELPTGKWVFSYPNIPLSLYFIKVEWYYFIY